MVLADTLEMHNVRMFKQIAVTMLLAGQELTLHKSVKILLIPLDIIVHIHQVVFVQILKLIVIIQFMDQQQLKR